ncbi:MAG: guanylate kinase [Gammaproteobacteria bacterium]|nr:guanylate kinase [Gammaproteobacteria bacterium]
MNKGILFTISAPSGAGKTRLVKALVERVPDLVLSISHTTRPQRPGEVDGEDYYFVSPEIFEMLVRQGAFLEHAHVFGNYYGTAQATVEIALQQGKNVLLEIDWQGAAQVRRLIPDAVSIFILPPSRPELERRLRCRGQDSEQVIAGRMAAARDEISHYAEADFIVVNDDFESAVSDTMAIIRGQRLRTEAVAPELADLIRSLMA